MGLASAVKHFRFADCLYDSARRFLDTLMGVAYILLVKTTIWTGSTRLRLSFGGAGRIIWISFLRHFPEESGETQSRPSGGEFINLIVFKFGDYKRSGTKLAKYLASS
jgi:hypothetical protein